MLETYRGHRITAINAGPRGWRSYVDMVDVTDDSRQGPLLMTQETALAWARECVDEAYEAERALQLREAIAAHGGPLLRLVHDADRIERVAAGIGFPEDGMC
jgi:hypothetical protein